MGMEKKRVICFKLLGMFSYRILDEGECSYAEKIADNHEGTEYRTVTGKVGKKTLAFLQYLVVNHSRNITVEELIDTFWSEKNSSNPANALRNMLFKIRNLLKDMFPEEDELLQTLQGCYTWNPRIRIELDTEYFEKICLEARQELRGNGIESFRQAIAIYHGDYLSGNDCEWAGALRQYYKTLYLDACKSILPMLEQKEEWMEIINLCGQAYQIDFCMEEFTAYQMQAFIAMGQPEQAIERYESFRKRMLKELEMLPSERIERIYTLALSLRKENRSDDGEIFKMVCEGNEGKHAFFCSFGMFRSIVALERRHLARSGQKSTLVIVTLGKKATPVTDARRLERILTEGLRNGDPVARLEAGSYILMLTGADTENAQIVISRLDCAFHKTYRHSNAQLSFKISMLCPAEER